MVIEDNEFGSVLLTKEQIVERLRPDKGPLEISLVTIQLPNCEEIVDAFHISLQVPHVISYSVTKEKSLEDDESLIFLQQDLCVVNQYMKEFALAFYVHLSRGLTIDESITNAQQEIKKTLIYDCHVHKRLDIQVCYNGLPFDHQVDTHRHTD